MSLFFATIHSILQMNIASKYYYFACYTWLRPNERSVCALHFINFLWRPPNIIINGWQKCIARSVAWKKYSSNGGLMGVLGYNCNMFKQFVNFNNNDIYFLRDIYIFVVRVSVSENHQSLIILWVIYVNLRLYFTI